MRSNLDETTETIPAADREFENITMEFLAFQYAAHPVMATRKGVHEYDEGLDSFQRFAIRDDRDQVRAYLHAIDKISLADLSFDMRVDYRVARSSAQMTLAALEHQRWPETRPDRYLDTIFSGLSLLIDRDSDPASVRAPGLLGRLRTVPEALAEAQNNLQKPPRLFLEAALEQTESGALLFSESLPAFVASLRDVPLKNALREAAVPAQTALTDFARFLRENLLPHASEEFALGRERFDYFLRVGHLMPETADELLAIGREEIALAQKELTETAHRVEPGGAWEAQLIHLRKSHPKAGELTEAYAQEIIKARDFIEYHRLMTPPESEELRVETTPAWARAAFPGVTYRPAAPFEEQQTGHLWVAPPTKGLPPKLREAELQEHSQCQIPLVALHEGYPGRHLQTGRANQTASRFRRHFAESGLFTEGWAAYCEGMMWEHGYFNDPRIRLMQWRNRLEQACVAVIDVEIHTQGKSLHDATQFLQDTAKTGLIPARAAALRCAMAPTQGMTAVMGRRSLSSLRDEMMRRQGARFTARRFHDRLLAEGSIQPSLLREIFFAVR